MNEIDLIKLLSQSGIAVAALYVLARIVWRVGERMIAAIDRFGVKLDEHGERMIAAVERFGERIGSKIDDHTKADTSALAAVSVHVSSLRQDIAVLSSSVNTVIDMHERTPTNIMDTGSHRRVVVPVSADEDVRPTSEYGLRRLPRERY